MTNIKNILVPIDFSTCANNALKYAIEIANVFKANLYVANAYHIPVPIAEGAMISYTTLYEEVAKDSEKSLEKAINKINTKDVSIKKLAVAGYLIDVLESIISKNKIDLVIMGTKGEGNISNKLLGSNTSHIMKKIITPVLAIPDGYSFTPIKNIAFASDYQPTKSGQLNPLKQVAEKFNAHIHIINVTDKVEKTTVEEASTGIQLDHFLENVSHSFHLEDNDNVFEGIQNYIDTHPIDMLSIIPRQHSFLDKLFTSSVSKKLALKANIPILSFREH